MARTTDGMIGVVRDLYTALKQGDERRIGALLDPDVVFELPEDWAYIGGQHRGAAEIFDNVWGPLLRDWDLKLDITDLLDCGAGRVLAIGRYKGHLRKDGHELNAKLFHLWTVRNGRIVHLEHCTNTAVWNQAWERP